MKLYFWQPIAARKRHIVNDSDKKSLCGIWRDYMDSDGPGRSPVKGDEVFDPDTDCKRCFARLKSVKSDAQNGDE
jgi:hypothetical protein